VNSKFAVKNYQLTKFPSARLLSLTIFEFQLEILVSALFIAFGKSTINLGTLCPQPAVRRYWTV